MNDTSKKSKKIYETPKIEHLGKLGTLIQGSTGIRKDAFPYTSSTRP